MRPVLAWSLSRLGVETYRSYVLPVILATLVHLVMLALIAAQWFDFSEPPRPQPRHLQARMIDLSSLQPDQAAAQQAAEQARAQEQARQAEQQRQEQSVAEQQRQDDQRQQVEQQRQEEQQRQQQEREVEQQRQQELVAQREAESRIRAEQERQQQADAERQRREEAERQAAAEQRRQEERRQAEDRQRQEDAQAKAREEARQREAAQAEARQREAQAQAQAEARAEAQRAAQAAADAVIGDIGSYISAMLTRNWNIPATARLGMQATVEIQLMPNGEIADVRIVQSSGDLAFDRSAEQAVRRTERLPRVAEVDPILFERRLRRTQVIFRPEGLRW